MDVIEYTVYDNNGREIGSIEIDPNDYATVELPLELEINGVFYYPEF